MHRSLHLVPVTRNVAFPRLIAEIPFFSLNFLKKR